MFMFQTIVNQPCLIIIFLYDISYYFLNNILEILVQ